MKMEGNTQFKKLEHLCLLHCPLCNRRGAIVYHGVNHNPCCDWDNENDSLTGWGNNHDECCPYPGVKSQKKTCNSDERKVTKYDMTKC